MLRAVAVALLVLAADQLTKAIVRGSVGRGEQVDLVSACTS